MIRDKYLQAGQYLKDNNLSNVTSAKLALRNKFGLEYDDFISNLQSRKTDATPSPANTPANINPPKVEAPQLAKKTLDSSWTNNLNKQLTEMWYNDEKIQDYYKKNNITTKEPAPRAETFGAPDNNIGTKTDTKYTPASSLQDWMDRGKKPTELIDVVESKYGVKAEYDPSKNIVYWFNDKWEKVNQWTFDAGGNPIREDVYAGSSFITDFQSMIDSGVATDKQVKSFLSKNIGLASENKEDVREMYKTFTKQYKIRETASSLISLDWKWLFDAYSKGKFVKWDDVWNALPPEVQARFESFYAGNIRTLVTKTDADGNLVPIVANLESTDEEEIYNALAQHNPEYQKKFNEIVVENSERKSLRNDLNQNYGELEKKRAEINKLRDKIKKQYPSSSPSFINAKINKEKGALLDDIEDLTAQYNTSLMSYNMIDADVQAEYQAYQQDAQTELATYQQAVQIKLDRIKEQTTFENNQELTQIAFDNQKELIDIQFENNKLVQDRTEAFNWKIKEFDAKRVDESGEYITNDKGQLLYVTKNDPTNAKVVLDGLGRSISTSEYQNYTEKLIEHDDGSFTTIRSYKDGTAPTVSTYNQQGVLVSGVPAIVNDALRSIPDEWKWCGQAVNDYLENLGLPRIMEDGYDTPINWQSTAKTDHINSEDPAIWALAIWNPSKPQDKYYENGHVWIVTGISADGETLEVTSWNMKWDKKKTVDQVPRSLIENTWGYHVPNLSTSEWESEESENIWYFNEKWTQVWTQKDVENWADRIYRWENKVTEVPDEMQNAVVAQLDTFRVRELPEIQDTIDLIETIINHKGRWPRTWGVIWTNQWYLWGGWIPTRIWDMTLPWSAARDFEALVQQLESKLFLTNIQALKWLWSLSNAEWLKVSGAQGTLTDFWQSEKAYKAMLEWILEKTQRVYNETEEIVVKKEKENDPMSLNSDEYGSGDDPLELYQ